MGLDLVELEMEIEDAFDIKIADEEYVGLETVGQVFDYLCHRLNAQAAQACTTQSTFYRLRAAMIQTLGLDRHLLRPDVALDALLPPRNWHREWNRLTDSSGLRLPKLKLSDTKTDWEILILLIGLTLAGFGLLHSVSAACCIVVGSFFLAGLASPRSSSGESFLTAGMSLREVVERIEVPDPSIISSRWTDEQVWLKLKQAVVKVLGVKPHEVTLQSDFVKDLGAT
jgi:acyl carrier protein